MALTLIAGNWKMNGLRASLSEAASIAAGLPQNVPGRQFLLNLPATLVAEAAARFAGTSLQIGAQVCHTNVSGAHTGDVSAEMLADAGASHVICGHSERRRDHHEHNEHVRGTVAAALRAGLKPILCLGETMLERHSGLVSEVVLGQLEGSLPSQFPSEKLIIAYEPVWAIGTGATATVPQVSAVHQMIRLWLEQRYGDEAQEIPILYGGSMTPANATEILSADHVNGGLIGGASLKANDFLAICRAGL